MPRITAYYSSDKDFAKFDRRPTMRISAGWCIQAHKRAHKRNPLHRKFRIARFLAIAAQSRYSSRFAEFETFRLDRVAEKCLIPEWYSCIAFSSSSPATRRVFAEDALFVARFVSRQFRRPFLYLAFRFKK